MVTGRKACQHGTPCQPTELAQAVHCLIQHGALSVDQLAGALAERFDIHVARHTLYEWSNPYAPAKDLSCPIRVIFAASVVQHSPVVLEFLARSLHYRVEPIAASVPSAARVRDEALDVVGAIGRAAEQVRTITSDGHITDDERASTRPFLRDVKQQTAELEAALEAGRTA